MTTILNNNAIKKIHFIGIGGIGMSGLAEILQAKGYEVTGSDIASNKMIERLENLGIKITVGHNSENVGNAQAIVYTSAVNAENAEFHKATQKNLPIVKRGELLAELMKGSDEIDVAGTHGKTTTTSIIIHLLLEANLDPTFVLGGILTNQKSSVRLGNGKYFVAESDESDASFLFLNPKFAIVTNIDEDHLSTYQGSFARLKQSFVQFLKKIPADGLAILNIDDPSVREIIPQLDCRIITYGFNPASDVSATNYSQKGTQSFFTVNGFAQVSNLLVKLNLPGQHNASNTLAVIALASELGISEKILLKALESFPGVGRRFHSNGEIAVKNGRALLLDDYGHHPNEIRVTLNAAKQAWPSQRVVLVFQPHRYSRTQDLMSAFVDVLRQADLLILVNVYSAGEAPIAGADSESLYKMINKEGKIDSILVPQLDELPNVLHNVLQSGDIVLFQGAGSIGPMANSISNNELFKV